MLDDADRPRAARGVPLSPSQQAARVHLRAIHDAFRGELGALLERVEQVRRGEAMPADVRETVHHLSLGWGRQDLTGHCAQFCRFVTMHHTIEDQAMFPVVAGLDGFRPVVERLQEEHELVHEHLVHIDRVLVRMHCDASAFEDLAEAVTALSTVLLSHFRYEEDELGEALGLSGLLV